MDVGSLILHGNFRQISNAGVQIAVGNTAQRPAAAAGFIRYNTDVSRFETNNGAAWANIGLGDGTVSSVNLTSSTSGITVTGNAVTSSGTFTLNLAGELAGLNALAANGLVQRTGAGAYTAVSTLPIANGGTGANTAVQALTNLGALPTAGGVMTGVLTLAADPTSALQASTKSYVDNAVATAVATDTYTAGAGLTLTAKQFSANTSGVTTGIVSNAIVVRSTATAGQTLLSSGTAGGEAAWGALNLASANAVTGALPITNGGTGATTAAAARAALGVPGVYRLAFTSANLSSNLLTVTHNLGQQFVQVSVTDNNNNYIEPDNVNMTSNAVTTIDFTSFATITGTYNVVVIG